MFISALRTTALLLILCCVIYPALVTALAWGLMPAQARGSWVYREDGSIVGSMLIGQNFESPSYLHGRPSAAGAGYDAAASSGSNLGMYSQKRADRREADRARLLQENPEAQGEVPEALLAASASGLDPDLPIEAAGYQLPRIAHARGVALARLQSLLEEQKMGRDLGVLGEERVNVLAFNLALDRRFGKAP